MAKRFCYLPALSLVASLMPITLAVMLVAVRSQAETCQATQTAITTAPSTINTQDINLDKSFMQDGDSERAQYSNRDGDSVSKEIFISATVDTASGDATLIIRDLGTGLSANAAGAFGNDGVIATSLSGIIGGIQKLITVTCQK